MATLITSAHNLRKKNHFGFVNFAELPKLWRVDEKELDDQALLALIAKKNEAALGILFDRYNRLIMTIAFHVVGNWDTAEEITLDIFVTVWEKAGVYDANKAEVRTWLTRITRNRAIDVTRHERSRPLAYQAEWAEVDQASEFEQQNPETATELALHKHRIRTAVAALPEAQKEALWLAYFGGYTHREIAHKLNQPLGTVKTRIRSAMQKLKATLADSSQSVEEKSKKQDNTYV